MLSLKKSILLKSKLIYLILSTYILSFFFEHYLKFEYKFARFSIVEIIFVVIIFFTLLVFRLDFIRFALKFDKKNIFEAIIYLLLILKLIKYSLDFQDYYNLYELLIWVYMLAIYTVYKFYLSNVKNLIYYLENSFITVSLVISAHIIYSYFLYKLGHEPNGLWMIRDLTYYPYVGTSPINFRSIFMDYNQPAHLVAPGFLFLLSRFNKKLIISTLIILYFTVFYLLKSKFFLIFFSILGVYLIIKKLNLLNKKLIKVFLTLSIITLSVFYFIVTHYILVEKSTINSSNLNLFEHYYFTDFVINMKEHDIYGSLFLKLKYTAIELAKNYNYIFFESSNYFNHDIVLKNFNSYTDPHSDYFGALANYGIIGFLIFLVLPIYIIFEYLKNFNKKKEYNNSLIYFLIIVMIFIEAIIVDFFHTQFIWIIFAMHIYSIKTKKDTP